MRLHPGTRIVLVYLAVALPWVLLTDAALQSLAPSAQIEHVLGSVKGGGFVLVTSAALFVMLRPRFDALMAARSKAEAGEALLRGLVASVGDVVFTTDAAGRYTGLYGPLVQPEHVAGILGRTPLELFGPDIGKAYLELTQRALTGEAVTVVWTQADQPLQLISGDPRVTAMRLSISPIHNAAGAVVGVIGSGRDVSQLIAAERERDAQTQQLTWLTYHDELTGLPNLALLRERIGTGVAAATRDGDIVALHLINADAFKDINDTLGHAAGDDLIRSMSERIRRQVGDAETVARLGGDEFAVVQVAGAVPEATRLADRLVRAFIVPFTTGGQQVFLTASVGVALYPADGMSVDDLLRAATTALHRAKADGRGRYEFYLPEMGEAARGRLEGMNALRRAVRAGELTVFFQPVVTATDGWVVAVEALARWSDPVLGEVPPDTFIPLAEMGGFVHDIDLSVRQQALDWLARWRRAGLDIQLHVNASEQSVRRPGFTERLLVEAQARDIPPDRLVVEVTESVFVGVDEGPADALAALAQAGFGLAIDDYGTGYASLNYVRRLPFTMIKLAREFATGASQSERDREIVRSTIALGRHLGMVVVVEGVEDEEERALLATLNADLLQGFLIAQPMPGDEVEAWCRTHGGLTSEERG